LMIGTASCPTLSTLHFSITIVTKQRICCNATLYDLYRVSIFNQVLTTKR
jgi:hypothetical protein